jgi:hypothetical protein
MKKETFKKKQEQDMKTKGHSIRTLNGVTVFKMGSMAKPNDKKD